MRSGFSGLLARHWAEAIRQFRLHVVANENLRGIHSLREAKQILKEGDIVSIDIPACKIEMQVDEATLAARKAAWVCPEPKVKTGYLARYAKLVSSADKGAILEL